MQLLLYTLCAFARKHMLAALPQNEEVQFISTKIIVMGAELAKI
jgi:hypothetical protein